MAVTDVDAFLAHHGVLGMKWHHHKPQDDTSSEKSNDYRSAISTKPRSHEEAVASIKTSQAKADAKLEPSEAGSEKRFLNSRNLKIAGGVAAVGAIAALGVYEAKNNPELLDKIAARAGKKVDPEEFNKAVDFSKAYSWGEFGYVKPESFERPEYSIPANTVFHRVSSQAEHSFNGATYSTATTDDFNRYLTSFGGAGKTPQHISWSAKDEIKVPALSKVLETYHETMAEEYANASPKARKALDAQAIGGKFLSKEHVLQSYEGSSGGAWSGPRETNFVTKLKAKGYGAIVDEMDSGVSGGNPLVLFSSEKMSAKSSSPITEAMRIAARENLKELENRKLPVSVTHKMSVFLKGGTMPTVIRDPDLARQDLAADFLRHHGVLGMKWGHHRSEGGDSGGSGKSGGSAPKVKKVKPTTQEIHDARARSDSRVRQINAQIDKANLSPTEKGRNDAAAAIKKIQDEGQGDLKIAMKSTRGEKVANGILIGVTGALIVGHIAVVKHI